MLTEFDCRMGCFSKEKINDFLVMGFQVQIKTKPVKKRERIARLLMKFLDNSILFEYESKKEKLYVYL